MKTFRILFLLIFLSSCSTTNISYDYDHTIDFEQYHTYALYPELQTGLNVFDEKRLLKSIKQELQEEQITPSNNPDFYINVFTEEYTEPNRSNIGIGVGGGGGNLGVGVSGGFPLGGPDTYLRIIIDFIDVRSDALIWQAVIDSKFNQDASPEKQEHQFNKIIGKAFKKYPPGK